MANASGKTVTLEHMDILWVKAAIETQKNVLTRSRTKEMPGSKIWELRGEEIQALNKLMEKFV